MYSLAHGEKKQRGTEQKRQEREGMYSRRKCGGTKDECLTAMISGLDSQSCRLFEKKAETNILRERRNNWSYNRNDYNDNVEKHDDEKT